MRWSATRNVPSCWNKVSPKSNYSRCRKKSCNLFVSWTAITVSEASWKNQQPTISAEEMAHHIVPLGEYKDFDAIFDDWCLVRSTRYVCCHIYSIENGLHCWKNIESASLNDLNTVRVDTCLCKKCCVDRNIEAHITSIFSGNLMGLNTPVPCPVTLVVSVNMVTHVTIIFCLWYRPTGRDFGRVGIIQIFFESRLWQQLHIPQCSNT